MQFVGLRIPSLPQRQGILEHLLNSMFHTPQLLFDLFGGHLGIGRVYAAFDATDLGFDVSFDAVEA